MSTRPVLAALRGFAGPGANGSGHLEKWISGTGGLAGLLGVMLVSQACLGLSGSASLVASMGASAVLLFAVPHGPLSQPWPLVGGHLVSAVIGVACARLNAQPLIGSALAVALAISAMYYLRCIHPPGGATALTAVAGGDAIRALGFHYVLTPVLLNVLVILFVAIAFNVAFPWRRYPAVWARKQNRPAAPAAGKPPAGLATGEDIASAAAAMDRAAGVSEDALYSPAPCNAGSGPLHPADIRVDGYYCNGAFGPDWQVRRVIGDAGPVTAVSGANTMVTYRIVAGNKRRHVGTARLKDFAGWVRYEVSLNENSWQRVDTTPRCAVTGDTA